MKKQSSTEVLITNKEFDELIKPIIGLPISWVWRGYGSAIFLEIGQLTSEQTQKDGKEHIYYTGEHGVMIEWSWRVERPKSIYFGSWSTNKVIDNRLPKLKDRIIEGIEVQGRLLELNIKLSGGLWLHSFATSEGQTQWCLFFNKLSSRKWLLSKFGKLFSGS